MHNPYKSIRIAQYRALKGLSLRFGVRPKPQLDPSLTNRFFMNNALKAKPWLALLAVCLWLPLSGTAQNLLKKNYKNPKKLEKALLKEADKAIGFEEHYNAIPFIKAAMAIDSNNAKLLFKLGYCQFEAATSDHGLASFELAYRLDPYAHPELMYYLGRALHFNYRYDDAIEVFRQEMKKVAPQSQEYQNMELWIKQCENGKFLSQNPSKMVIQNVGATINTPYPEYAPAFNQYEDLLYFTRRHPENEGDLAADGLPHEDMYESYKQGKTWTEAQKLGKPFNSHLHDASIAFWNHDETLVMYRHKHGGDIMVSHKQDNDAWSKPKSISKKINTLWWEMSACISPDSSYLIYISNKKKGGYGGRDIYICTKDDKGRWQIGENIGFTINTPADEDCPFLAPDGKTLYFSSKGHNGLGGFDVYKTVMSPDGTWSQPQNMGFPLNGPGDDVFFVLTANGQSAHYVSTRPEGYGANDIYFIRFLIAKVPLIALRKLRTGMDYQIADTKWTVPPPDAPKMILLQGTTTDADKQFTIPAFIYIIDNVTGDTLTRLESNLLTGQFLYPLQPGKSYKIMAKAPGYLPYTENILVPNNVPITELPVDLKLQPAIVGKKLILKNIFFDFDKADLLPESIAELKNLVNIMNDLPMLRIRIGGHTDNFGSDDYNEVLSQRRAQAVVDYLIKAGIDPSRFEAKGYGEKVPIDTNDTTEGRARNRRTEFEVISID